jgi:hypothetical protein
MLIVGYPKREVKLERIDAIVVNDAVDVDVSDVTFLRKLSLHLPKSVWLKMRFGVLQNIEVPISPVGGPRLPGKSFLCSKLTLIG